MYLGAICMIKQGKYLIPHASVHVAGGLELLLLNSHLFDSHP